MVPTFYPTMGEFEKFTDYVKSIKEHCGCGLAKIVPPKEWLESEEMKRVKAKYEKLDNYKIMDPIKQYAEGTKGAYRVANVIERKCLTVGKFKELAEKQTEQAKYLKKDENDENEIRRKFWKNLTFSPPIYGADSSGTLMGEDIKHWNLNNLGCLLEKVGEKVPGINTPYLYFGMWKAFFAVHTEDMDLYSINYLHFGENKIWYCIPEKESSRFESMAQSIFPLDHKNCDQFLRHKSFLFSPSLLHDHNITVSTATQHPGEFMITFPRSYHFGFNCGFNCAEAVNFAMDDWINFGKKAKICLCNTDSPRIPMDYFIDTPSNNCTNNTNDSIDFNSSYGSNDINHTLPSPISGEANQQYHPLLTLDPQQFQQNLKDFNNALQNRKQFDEDTNSTWTINCVCGLRQIHSPDFVKTISSCTVPVLSGVLFECVGCFSWCHVECFDQYKGIDPLPVDMYCHDCIKKKKIDVEDSKKRKPTVPSPNKLSPSKKSKENN